MTVLGCLRGGQASAREIAVLTGMPEGAVWRELSRLRRNGVRWRMEGGRLSEAAGDGCTGGCAGSVCGVQRGRS